MNVLELEGGRGLAVDAGRHGPWMQTWTGIRFYPDDPRKADVEIMDIAFALGNISRYGGHCRFYSVAEHSVLVSLMVPEHLALEGLMHDATEAYIGDVIRPLKRALGASNNYFAIEDGVRAAIAAQFGLDSEVPEEVVSADVRLVTLEKRVLHPRSTPWDLAHPAPRLAIDCLTPRGATLRFLHRYCELSGDNFDGLLAVHDHLCGQDQVAFGQARMH